MRLNLKNEIEIESHREIANLIFENSISQGPPFEWRISG